MRFSQQWGRIGAILILLLTVWAIAQEDKAPLAHLRNAWFDGYQKYFPRERKSAPVVIVEIDEASQRKLGQWPWPRDVLAEMIRRVTAAGALAIGLDIYMPERDRTSPDMVAMHLPPELDALKDQLNTLPSHDRVMRDAIANSPTVLGAAGFDTETPSTSKSLRSFPLKIDASDPTPFVHRYPFVLASIPSLQKAASGSAVLSVDLEDGKVRRIPMIYNIAGQLVPSLALELFRVASRSEAISVSADRHGLKSMSVADLTLPTQADGRIWLHFSHYDSNRYISAETLLNVEPPLEALKDKIVLIGLTGLGLQDQRMTPLGEMIPGVDIQAQLIESLYDRHFLIRPDWMKWIEIGVLLTLGGLLMVFVPRMRLSHAFGSTLLIILVCLGSGVFLFVYTGLLFDSASLAAVIVLVYLTVMGSVYQNIQTDKKAAEGMLAQERLSAARVTGELEAARRIQLGSLPKPEVLFANEKRFEIAAILEPAREVGGDLYDFFMLDKHRLFFLVGDVSGKGLPASLFMSVTKALVKSVALRADSGLAHIIQATQRELSRENPEMLFVTMIAGILNVDTGELSLCNAGHDAPWRVSANGTVEQLTGTGGPPLCVLEEFNYPVDTVALQPGDALCVVTDGVTEAMNAKYELYGAARLEKILKRDVVKHTEHHRAAQAWLDDIRTDVSVFVANAEASDDLTLMVLRWGN